MSSFIPQSSWIRSAIVALTALANVAGAPASADITRTWSVAVHIRYLDGTVYDHAFATGVPREELTTTLQACARSHAWGHGVTFHCYAIPE
jgi:hypothetical protein